MLPYEIRGGGESVMTTLVIVKRNGAKKSTPLRKKYLVFVTNADRPKAKSILANIPKIYKKRWGIETRYRCAKQCRPFTCSRNPSVRLVLFYFIMIIYNAWNIINWFIRKEIPDSSNVRPPLTLYRMLEKIYDTCKKMILRNVAASQFFLEDIG